MKKDILILEDDTLLATTLLGVFEEHGYRCDIAYNGDEAIELCFSNTYHLYLFDVNLPTISGFELLQSLREAHDTTKAIFLTSKSMSADILKGFESGADDYIKKPFDLDELLARIKSKMPKRDVAYFGSKLAFDFENYRFEFEGKGFSLPKKETEVALYLLQHEGRVVSKDGLNDAIFRENPIADATIRVYIQKIKTAFTPFATLTNIRGVGYQIKLL